VLPGDHAPDISGPAAGTYASWSVGVLYPAGSKVLYNGLPYLAKWNNQGMSLQMGLAGSA